MARSCCLLKKTGRTASASSAATASSRYSVATCSSCKGGAAGFSTEALRWAWMGLDFALRDGGGTPACLGLQCFLWALPSCSQSWCARRSIAEFSSFSYQTTFTTSKLFTEWREL